MKVKEESGKVGLKLNIQKMKIMASSPITSWQIDGETMKPVRDFILVGSKTIAYLLYSSVGKILWSRKWQPTAAILPGEFHGQKSLVGYSPWGHEESDTIEQLTLHF